MQRILYIIATLFLLTGCGGTVQSVIDPEGYTRRTEAEQKTAQENAFAESQRWLAESKRAEADAQRADAEARADAQRADAEARAAEASSAAQQAQAQAQQAQAQAMAQQSQSYAEAMAKLGTAIKDAAKPNNLPIIIAILAIVLIAGWAIWNQRQTAVAIASRPMLAPPPEVKLIADSHGLTPIHDGQRWLLLDEEGHVVKRQKLITG